MPTNVVYKTPPKKKMRLLTIQNSRTSTAMFQSYQASINDHGEIVNLGDISLIITL